MKLMHFIYQGKKLSRENAPAIFTALGVSGTITTAYLTGKAAYKSAFVLLNLQAEERGISDPLTKKEVAEAVWKLYIPATMSGVVTVGCIIASAKVSAQRTAAIAAAYSISEKVFAEYAEKVVETLGEKKEQGIRDSIAQDRVRRNPPTLQEVTMAGPGNVLCCEMYTGRYFYSDMETLRKAQNELNSRIVRENYATLSDFYCIIGLGYTSTSCDVGWDSDKLMELRFSAVMSDDGRPCIAFDYNYTKPI